MCLSFPALEHVSGRPSSWRMKDFLIEKFQLINAEGMTVRKSLFDTFNEVTDLRTVIRGWNVMTRMLHLAWCLACRMWSVKNSRGHSHLNTVRKPRACNLCQCLALIFSRPFSSVAGNKHIYIGQQDTRGERCVAVSLDFIKGRWESGADVLGLPAGNSETLWILFLGEEMERLIRHTSSE